MADIKDSVLPLYRKISDVQSDLFPLSLSAEFKVSLNLGYDSDPGPNSPESLSTWLTKCGVANSPQDLARYDFFASEVTLPGASFDMAESMGDRQGTIERFAQRRLYAPLSVTFYVDSEYNIIRLFEEWMNFTNPIHNENGKYEGSFQGTKDYNQRNNYYKFRYPDDYRRNIVVTKFEKDFYQGANMNETRIRNGDDLVPGSLLFYQFIDAFPSNIVAIPLSFDGTQVIRATIEFQYLRYNVITNNNKDELYTTGLFGFTERTYDNSVVGQLGATSAKTTTQPGYVNGELYTGPFHVHERADGTKVRMIGQQHVGYSHNIIYDTLEESLAASGITTTTTTTDDDNNQQQESNNQEQSADTTAPVAPDNVSVTTAANDNTPTITGNAEGGSMIKVFNGTVEIGSTAASASGSFSITVANPLANGTYTFTITATDAAGNQSNTTSISHTIDVPSQEQENNQQQNNQQQNNQQNQGGGGGYGGGY